MTRELVAVLRKNFVFETYFARFHESISPFFPRINRILHRESTALFTKNQERFSPRVNITFYQDSRPTFTEATFCQKLKITFTQESRTLFIKNHHHFSSKNQQYFLPRIKTTFHHESRPVKSPVHATKDNHS